MTVNANQIKLNKEQELLMHQRANLARNKGINKEKKKSDRITKS